MDNVNHPVHYTQYGIEVIEITRHLDFCLGNAVKYVLRAPYKGGVEDLEKALWYLKRVAENDYYEMPYSKMEKFKDAYCQIMQSNINQFQKQFMMALMYYVGYGVFIYNMYSVISDWIKNYDTRSEDKS